MKANYLVLIVLLCLGSMATEVRAQENIKALMQKCESMEDVQMSRIRNKSGGGTEKVILSLSFKNNPQLLNAFAEACKKDEENASQIIESKVNGKLVPTFYKFGKASFSLSIDKEGTGASVSWIEN